MDGPLKPPPVLGPLSELEALEEIIRLGGAQLEVRSSPSAAVAGGAAWPVYRLALGNPSAQVPCVGFFGGVHGLERIGSRVVLALLHSLVSRLSWDTTLQSQLQAARLVFMPVVNPGGMLRATRANPNGVDLMRNAPVQSRETVAPLVGGQRISAGLPWYRGRAGAPMEPESQALCDLVAQEMHPRPFSLALDCHSGFGMRDRLWFPYAHQRAPMKQLPHVHALHQIFEASNLNHPYVFEPQSSQYLAHGDLWDHLMLQAPTEDGRVFLALTLEMGSWLWIRKNPRQLLSLPGMFNPHVAHREQRVLRRHLPLLDFVIRAAVASDRWLPRGEALAQHRRQGLARWYSGAVP